MFDRLEIRVLPPGPRFAAQLRFWVNGEDMVEEAVGEGGRGPYAADVLPAGPARCGPPSRRVAWSWGNRSAPVAAAAS